VAHYEMPREIPCHRFLRELLGICRSSNPWCCLRGAGWADW
jgi:hypothetical protein